MRFPSSFSSSLSLFSKLLTQTGSVDTPSNTTPTQVMPIEKQLTSSFTTSLSASADAVGESTFSSVDATINTTKVFGIAIAKGTITTTASAVSDEGETAYTSTSTDLSFSDADILIQFTKSASGSGVDDGEAWSTTTSTTSFLAIDLPDFINRKLFVNHEFSTIIVDPPELSGNLAVFNVGISASGEDTATDVQLESLAVEDQFSSVTLQASATAAADSWFMLV
jgi:hypothetical protein